MRSTNRYSFIRSLKRKGFKEEIVIKIGLYDLVTSTTLESNKSLAEMQSRPTEFLDFTSLTLDEFQQLVPPFEAAFQAHMAAWRLDGKPRTARQFAVYKNCPLPTPEDRLFFLLTYLPEDVQPPSRPGTPVRHGPEQGQSVDARAPARAAGGPAPPRCCPCPLVGCPGAAARRLGG